jgi:hypothetical protein
MRLFSALMLLLLAAPLARALDREAFTITRYQLEVQMDRNSHVMVVTGKLTLRNDSNKPQKIVALQVSSSLAWNSIMLDDKPLQWLSDNYTSDIDHTGGLSEAIVTLPKDLPPAAAVTLDVQYGGTITPDSTRLTRMGAPDDVAARNDWDEISDSFTAVRGLGYVVWYPVAIDAVSMSDGNAVFDAIAAWKHRHDRSEFNARIIVVGASTESLCIAVNAAVSSCGEARDVNDSESGGKLKAKWCPRSPWPTMRSFHVPPSPCCMSPITLRWRGITRSRPRPTIRCCTIGSASPRSRREWWS